MKRRIRDSLSGEQIVAVEPRPARLVDAGWQRRLNLYTGRALSGSALRAEQAWVAGHLTMLGQGFSPGVIQGLDVTTALRAVEAGDEPPEEPVIGDVDQVTVGPGVGLTASGEEIRLAEPLALALPEIPLLQSAEAEVDSTPERTLGSLAPEERPAACILLLQPIVGARIGELDPDDPCERDPGNEAFEDQQRVDGARLLLYAWPEEWLPLPEPRDATWRNRLAYRLFELEARAGAAEITPWEAVGLPVGLVALTEEARLEFLDRSAVRRLGGEPRPQRSLIAGAGDPFLWRARIEQFAEELGELEADGGPVDELAARFRHLPPVGTLPLAAADLATHLDRFFPSRFRVEAAPVPLEQIGRLVRAAAPLAPLDIAAPEVVRVSVPVPERLFEPNLLLRKAVDAVFVQTIEELAAEESLRHARQRDVAAKVRALARAVAGEAEGPAEPAGEEGLELPDGLVPPELDYGTGAEDRGALSVSALEALRGALGNSRVRGHLDQLDSLGLRGFILLLERLIRRADDQIDLGFLRVRTEIYRVRQWVLGNLDATRLATSPALAAVAQGQTARATEVQISDFLEQTRGVTPQRFESAPRRSGDGGARLGGEAMVAGIEGAESFRTATLGNTAATTFFGGGSRPPSDALPRPRDPFPRGGGAFELPDRPLEIDPRPTRPDPPPPQPPRPEPEVVEQPPILGEQLDFRTLTVAERLDRSPGIETRGFAVRRKFETVTALAALGEEGFNLDDFQVPNVAGAGATGAAAGRANVPLADLLREGADRLLDDPEPADGDEAAFFGAAVAQLDDSVNLVRALEGRVGAYRDALRRSRAALAEIEDHGRRAATRLAVLDRRLAEARHDLEVGRSLLAEETRRVEEINRRRRRVLAESVPFLLFHRPLETAVESGGPARRLDSLPRQEPIAACAGRGIEPPGQLRAMVDGLRDAPLLWFPALRRLLYRLDRLELVRGTLLQAQRRARLGPRFAAAAPTTVSSPLALAVFQVAEAQRQVLASTVQRAARLDLTGLGILGWNETRRMAEDVVSVGDLLEAGHGRSNVARQAAAELEKLADVAGCLYAGFSAVVPVTRLEWAQRLSQYDDPLDLRNLARLPGWEDLGFEERRELQALVAYLHGRIDPREREAVTWMNDLVRVAILLASHAPVDEIVRGAVAEDTPAQPGGRVRVLVDVARVRIGMGVLFEAGGAPVARAVVEDLDDEGAMIRVLTTYRDGLRLAGGAEVRFTPATSLALAPL